MNYLRKLSISAIAVGSLTLAACSHDSIIVPPPPMDDDLAPTVIPGPPAPPPAPVVTQPLAPVNQGPIPGSREDFLARTAADRVYFATDESVLDATARATLDSQARWLNQFPNVRAVIEGHCDERGTREYNLALGDRRANAAKNYLVAQGVNPARLSVMSYGKERPDALGSDEVSWAKNRRAVTVTIH